MEPWRHLHVTVRNFNDLVFVCHASRSFKWLPTKPCQWVLVLGLLHRGFLNLTISSNESKQTLHACPLCWTRITIIFTSLLYFEYLKDSELQSKRKTKSLTGKEDPFPTEGLPIPPTPPPLLLTFSVLASWVACCSSSAPALQPLHRH